MIVTKDHAILEIITNEILQGWLLSVAETSHGSFLNSNQMLKLEETFVIVGRCELKLLIKSRDGSF